MKRIKLGAPSKSFLSFVRFSISVHFCSCVISKKSLANVSTHSQQYDLTSFQVMLNIQYVDNNTSF